MKKYIYILFVAVFAFSCGEKKSAAPSTDNAVMEEYIPIKTAVVNNKSFVIPIHASGFLTSDSEQRLAFKIGGIIKKILVKEGDVVKKGQLLAVLDQTEINAQVALAQQGLQKAERDLARVDGLYKDSSATLELLQNATTGRDVAKENLEIAVFNQKYAEIRATENGKVIKKMMNEGEIIGPGMPVFVIFGNNNSDWIVKINTSDRDWARLNKGMVADVKMDAYPDTKFTGRISDLAPAADPSNGLYVVEVKVQPQGKRFAPGLFAEVDILPQKSHPYPFVPIESIVEGEGKSAFVFVYEENGGNATVRKVPISVVFLEGNMAAVSTKFAEGTQVVTAGSPYLRENSRVKKM